MNDILPVPEGEGPRISIDTWAYVTAAFGQIQTALGRLDAKIDGSASKEDVHLLRQDMISRDDRMNARVAILERAEHDRQILHDSHAARDEREGTSRSEKITRVVSILALLAAIGMVIVPLLH